MNKGENMKNNLLLFIYTSEYKTTRTCKKLC